MENRIIKRIVIKKDSIIEDVLVINIYSDNSIESNEDIFLSEFVYSKVSGWDSTEIKPLSFIKTDFGFQKNRNH